MDETRVQRLNRAAELLDLEDRLPDEAGAFQWSDLQTKIIVTLAERVGAKPTTLSLPGKRK